MGLPWLLGKHKDFSVNWYQDIGVKITITTITYAVSPIISRLVGEPLLMCLLRWWDRHYYKHLRKINNTKRNNVCCGLFESSTSNQKYKP